MSTWWILDLGELVKRALKYFVEGLIVALAAYVIPSKRLRLDETLHCPCRCRYILNFRHIPPSSPSVPAQALDSVLVPIL